MSKQTQKWQMEDYTRDKLHVDHSKHGKQMIWGKWAGIIWQCWGLAAVMSTYG